MGTRLIKLMALAGALGASAMASADVVETLYYTTFSGGENVWKVNVDYSGNGTAGSGTFTIATPVGIAATPGADGLVFNPNNNHLLVGGQGTGAIFDVNPTTGTYTALSAGQPVYEITVDPSGNSVWGGGSEQGIGSYTNVPLSPEGGAATLTAGEITHITFVPGMAPNTAFFTTGGDDGGGNFGTINLLTGAMTIDQSNVQCAHGMVYDPFTGDLIVSGGNELCQINPLNPTVDVSVGHFGSDALDQGAVDGNGDVYWADNNGNFLFVDYATTGLIGSASNFVSNSFFQGSLDDFAPLIGEGGSNTNTPEPATLGLLGLGLLGVGMARRRRALRG